MPQIKVKEFAKELGVQPELLIEQLQAAGVKKALTERNKNPDAKVPPLREVTLGRRSCMCLGN